MKYLNLKKYLVLLMIVMLFFVVVGCSVNNTAYDKTANGSDSVEPVEGAIQESEYETEPENLTEVDQQILAYFQEACDCIPKLKEECDAGSPTLALSYYEKFVTFSFSGALMVGDKCYFYDQIDFEAPYISFYDMSELGKIKYVELMREYDDSIYNVLPVDLQKIFDEEHGWIPYAEAMFGLTDTEFDEDELKRMEEEWLVGWDYPVYGAYYRDFYDTFFTAN